MLIILSDIHKHILKKTYQTGHKVAHDFKQTMRIDFDKELLKWNYTARPTPGS